MLEAAYTEYLNGNVSDAELQGALGLVYGTDEATRMMPRVRQKLLEKAKKGNDR